MVAPSATMKAVLLREFGPPSTLIISDHAMPAAVPGTALIHIKAFGLNHAEMHMRRGEWAESMPIIGIECVGVIVSCPSREFATGTVVAALMGGLGRTINGSYAEYTVAPVGNVVVLAEKEVDLCMAWKHVAAIPESYATAWMCLFGNLEVKGGQRLLIRGATSALGRAAVNLAVEKGVVVTATTRAPERYGEELMSMGVATVEKEGVGLPERIIGKIDGKHDKFDAVLDLIGNSTLLESLTLVLRGGRLCLAGWLGGLDPIHEFNPLLQMASGVHFSFFGSFVFGNDEFPLSEVPLGEIVRMVAEGKFQANPSRVFRFEDIQEAHRVMEAGEASGKMVVLGHQTS